MPPLRKMLAHYGTDMKKKYDQMLAVLAICEALTPNLPLDSQTRQALHESLGEKILRMQREEYGIFTDIFSYICPKFIVRGGSLNTLEP